MAVTVGASDGRMTERSAPTSCASPGIIVERGRRSPAVNTAEATAPLIALDQVTKTYGSGRSGLQALRGVDLRIAGASGHHGPSGSGKSTARTSSAA